MNPQAGKALAVGAHPDDVEILCAGTLFLLREHGFRLHVATMTLGDCGAVEHSADEICGIRRREAESACEVLGAAYHWLGFHDFQIFVDDESSRRVTALIREVAPKLIFTHPPQDYMYDHESTSLLVRNACFYAPAPNYDTSRWTEASPAPGIPHLFYLQPMEGADIFGNEVGAHFYVDISEVVERKVQMLSRHESQRNWLRAHHGMDEYVESMLHWNRLAGRTASELAGRPVEYAEAFRQHRGHAYPRDNALLEILGEKVIPARG